MRTVFRRRSLVVLSAVLLALGLAACEQKPTSTPTPPPPTPTATPAPVWLSAGPRGVQFTSDFKLVELFRNEEKIEEERGTSYEDLALDPQGKESYALSISHGERGYLEESALVRLSGSPGEPLKAEEVLKFSALKDPALWDPDMGPASFILPAPRYVPGRLALASNGDLFLLADAWTGITELPRDRPRDPPAGTSLIVRHVDGKLQKVLTVRELVAAGLLELPPTDQFLGLAVAPSAPDRFWLQAIINRPPTPTLRGATPSSWGVRRAIYEVRDLNADGDWSDRKVVPLVLPGFVAEVERGDCCTFMGLVAEPSKGGKDASPSFLLQMSTPYPDVEHRVYRISDKNGDGDALDAGEFELLFSGISPFDEGGSVPVVAPRLIVEDGRVKGRELLISSFAGSTRISRVTEMKEVIDIARAFNRIGDLAADLQGNIYVWASPPDGSRGRVLYKLQPLAKGEGPQPDASPVTSGRFPAPEPAAKPLTPGVPRVLFGLETFQPKTKNEVLLVGADGSGPVKQVPGERNSLFSPSPGGSRILFYSDEEVPNENFVYVANADGSSPRKIAEQRLKDPETGAFIPVTGIGPWVTDDSLLLSSRTGGTHRLILHDLNSGRQTILLKMERESGPWRLSADGRYLAFVSGSVQWESGKSQPSGQETLELLDVKTGERRRLHGPLTDSSYRPGELQWSQDGRRLAYLVSRVTAPLGREAREKEERGFRPPGPDYDLYAADVTGGEARLVYQFKGNPSECSCQWSPSSAWILVELRGSEGRLLVNAKSGEARQVGVAKGPSRSFGWSSKEDSFAYTTASTLYVQSVRGDVREVPLPTAVEEKCPDCDSGFGWSPDGRYIGLTDWWQTIAVLDTTTGEVRTLVKIDGNSQFISQLRWGR